jgi:hypothetical protein
MRRTGNGAIPAGPPRVVQLPAKVAEPRSNASVSAAMRRRRDAAQRLPVLESGHSDPLDELADLPVPADEYDVETLGLNCPHDENCPARTETR